MKKKEKNIPILYKIGFVDECICMEYKISQTNGKRWTLLGE